MCMFGFTTERESQQPKFKVMQGPVGKGNGMSATDMFTVTFGDNGEVTIEYGRTCIDLRLTYLQHAQGAPTANMSGRVWEVHAHRQQGYQQLCASKGNIVI